MSVNKLVLQSEEVTTDFSKLTQQQKDARADEAQSFINRLKIDLNTDGVSKDILFSNTKDILQEWALALEELHYLGKYTNPINTISKFIRNEIGKLEGIPLEKKEKVWSWMHQSLHDRFKLSTKPKDKEREKLDLFTSDLELTEEQQFLLDTLESLEKFYGSMESIVKTMKEHMKDPNLNADMLKHFDKYHKIAALREPIEFMMGEGSILHQMDDEQNIRESATILQKAIAMSMGTALSYRQMAHGFSVVPRQNQRIRKRLADWPKKDIATVIRKNILSYCCQNPECGMNVITGKKYNSNGDVIGEVKLSHKSYPIPKQFQGKPLSPIQIAIEVAKKL